MELETVAVFGMGIVAIIYWLVAHARRNGLIKSGAVAFLTVGVIWGALLALYGHGEGFKRAPFVYVAAWLGGWAATLLFKAGAKDNERSPDPGAQ